MNNTELEGLFDQIRRLFAAEYARGDRDAITRIMQAAKGGAGGDNSGKEFRGECGLRSPIGERPPVQPTS